MKKLNHLLLVAVMFMALFLSAATPNGRETQSELNLQEGEDPTETPVTPEPTETPEPTATTAPTATLEPTATATLGPTDRPLVVISSYSSGDGVVTPGYEFTLSLRIKNKGAARAQNMIVTFQSGDFMPMETGGVQAITSLGVGDTKEISQPMRANFGLWGYDAGSLQVSISYSDPLGTAYTESFTVSIPLKVPSTSGASATATPTTQPSAQLVVESYASDVDPLQPGSIFNLNIQLRNLGTVDARNVSMVLGGGVNLDNDPQNGGSSNPGGLSGGGADLTNFAPLGRSNVVFLDTVASNGSASAAVNLVVNVSTTPGAYPFKISFVYDDPDGERVVDDQVITLLVYSLPKLQFSFYRDPGMLFTNQMNSLPLQLTNLGKTTAVLGNMTVTTTMGDLTENTIMVGALEPGGYYTMDSFFFPFMAGEVPLTLSVTYTDDFNQPRTVEGELIVMVEEQPVMEPMPDQMYPEGQPEMNQPETFLQKVWRFIKGLLGLGSEKQDNEPVMPVMEEQPIPAPEMISPKG
ncbi:MAG: hypothetical protein JW750_01015 [Anaerolineaceae bacterium]|nr:hypothetical protein [Anaerolineaceae bacterium]